MKNIPFSLTKRDACISKMDKILSDNPGQGYYVQLTKKEKARGLPANAQQHVWYGQIAGYNDDDTPINAKRFCKYMFGLQISLSSEKLQPVTSFLIEELRYHKYQYKNQLKLMDVIVRTSDFSAKESKMYMDAMIEYYNDIDNGACIPIKYQED